MARAYIIYLSERQSEREIFLQQLPPHPHPTQQRKGPGVSQTADTSQKAKDVGHALHILQKAGAAEDTWASNLHSNKGWCCGKE